MILDAPFNAVVVFALGPASASGSSFSTSASSCSSFCVALALETRADRRMPSVLGRGCRGRVREKCGRWEGGSGSSELGPPPLLRPGPAARHTTANALVAEPLHQKAGLDAHTGRQVIAQKRRSWIQGRATIYRDGKGEGKQDPRHLDGRLVILASIRRLEASPA